MGNMVPVTEFKAKCLALLEEMERSGEPLTITRRGKPALTLIARAAEKPSYDNLFGSMKDTIVVHGDIVGPTSDEPWDAELGRWDPTA